MADQPGENNPKVGGNTSAFKEKGVFALFRELFATNPGSFTTNDQRTLVAARSFSR